MTTRVGADGRWAQLQPVADYLAQPAAEVVALLSPGRIMPAPRGRVRTFAVGQARLGQAPTAVDRDDRTGLIVVG